MFTDPKQTNYSLGDNTPGMAILRTSRLVLRRAKVADLTAIHALLCNVRATAFSSDPPHHSLEQSRKWLADMIAIPAQQGEDFVVEHEGRVIGKAGLYRFPEIGFIFHPDVWGSGFALEAIRPLLDRAFNVHALRSVTAEVDPCNEASLRLLDRLGFYRTGTRERISWSGSRWCRRIDLALDRRSRR